MSYYNNYVNNNSSSYRTKQVSPKYSLDSQGKSRGSRASPTPDSAAAYRQTTQSNKNESSNHRSSHGLQQRNQSKEFKQSSMLKSRESSNANSLKGNQFDLTNNQGDNNHGLQTGQSRQAAHEPLDIVQTLNLNALKRSTKHQTSPSKFPFVISKHKKTGGTLTAKQSPSPIMDRQGLASSKNSYYKVEQQAKSTQKLVIKTNEGSKKNSGQPVKKVIKRALIDIRHNQLGDPKKQQSKIIDMEQSNQQVGSQNRSRNRLVAAQIKPQISQIDSISSGQGRQMGKTPYNRVGNNNIASRGPDDSSNKSNNSQMRGEGSNSRGNSQNERINMIYNRYISDNKGGNSGKAGEKPLSPSKHVKQSSIIKKQPMPSQKHSLQVQTGAQKMSKAHKIQDARGIHREAQPNNQNVSEKRSNSRSPLNCSQSPKSVNQNHSASKRKINTVDPKSGIVRQSPYTMMNTGNIQDPNTQKLKQQLSSKHPLQSHNSLMSSENNNNQISHGNRADKQRKEIGQYSLKIPKAEKNSKSQERELIKFNLPPTDTQLNHHDQSLQDQLQSKLSSQRERPRSRRRNQMKKYQQNHIGQPSPRDKNLQKNHFSSSGRSMSNSSKNIESIRRTKLQTRNNHSIGSTQKIGSQQDDKNLISNHRSRSIQLNRGHGTQPSSKSNRKTKLQQHQIQAKIQGTKAAKRIQSLSNSSNSSHFDFIKQNEISDKLLKQKLMNKTQALGSKYDIRSHKINIGIPKKQSTQKEPAMHVDLMNTSPSRFSINKMSAGSSRNLRYQQQDEDFLEDNVDCNVRIQSGDNKGSRKSSLEKDKSKHEFPKSAKQDPALKVEVISTMKIKKEKQHRIDKKKYIVDKQGSIVQDIEVFNKAFDLIKTAEQMEESNNVKKASINGDSVEKAETNSLSSNDSLIQTQRQLKQEYAVRLSQQAINPKKQKQQRHQQYNHDEYSHTPEFTKQIDDELEKRPRIAKTMNKVDPFNMAETNNSGLKQKLVKRARISLIDKEKSNVSGTIYKDGFGSNLKTGKKKKSGPRFPIHEFISASSDQEEDFIIEKYSQELRSQERVIEKKKRDSMISGKGSNNFRKQPTNIDLQTQDRSNR